MKTRLQEHDIKEFERFMRENNDNLEEPSHFVEDDVIARNDVVKNNGYKDLNNN